MNIHAGTASRTPARTCCRRPATRCPRRARRATSGRRGWCRTPAATPRPARWPCWRCCAARSSTADGIIIDAASGTTGAGRKASEDFSFSEVDGDFRAYRVLRHQHTPGDRARAGAGRPAAAQGDVHAPPAADAAGHPGDRLWPAESRQDRRRRRGGDRALRGGQAVPARAPSRTPSACTRSSAPTGCCWAPTPIRSAASRSRSRRSTTWSRGPPARRSRTPT